MSHDMFTAACETHGEEKKKVMTWQDLMVEAWKGKASKCPCKGGLPTSLVCMMTYQECSMNNCPFVLWGCL
jgi:hypothetical protein